MAFDQEPSYIKPPNEVPSSHEVEKPKPEYRADFVWKDLIYGDNQMLLRNELKDVGLDGLFSALGLSLFGRNMQHGRTGGAGTLRFYVTKPEEAAPKSVDGRGIYQVDNFEYSLCSVVTADAPAAPSIPDIKSFPDKHLVIKLSDVIRPLENAYLEAQMSDGARLTPEFFNFMDLVWSRQPDIEKPYKDRFKEHWEKQGMKEPDEILLDLSRGIGFFDKVGLEYVWNATDTTDRIVRKK